MSIQLSIPKPLRDHIDEHKGLRSFPAYIIKCIDYIKQNNIDINKFYEEDSNDPTKLTTSGGAGKD